MFWQTLKYWGGFCSVFMNTFLYSQPSINSKLKDSKQQINQKYDAKKKTIFGGFFNTDITNPQQYLGVRANALTSGWELGLVYGRLPKNKQILITLSEWKHDKEEKLKPQLTEIQGLGKPLPYIYGKVNSFYSFNLQYGYSKILLKAFILPGIDLHINIRGGLSLGLLKPYYLLLNTSGTPGSYAIQEVKFSHTHHQYFLNQNRIYSRSKFTKGINDITIIPGMNVSPNFVVDIGNHSVWIKQLEFGSTAYVYSSKIQLLADTKPKSINLNFNMGIILAKGW